MFTEFKCSEIKLYRVAVMLLYSHLIHCISFYGSNTKHQIWPLQLFLSMDCKDLGSVAGVVGGWIHSWLSWI